MGQHAYPPGILPLALWIVAAADVVLVLKPDPRGTKNLTESNRRVMVHLVKNRAGERGTLAYEFFPAFSRFVEVESS